MDLDTHVLNQWLVDFTVEILTLDDETSGTGIAVSADGKIVTCAHVIKQVLGVHPREAGNQTVPVYFPRARRGDKQRKAKVIGCFPDHDDDIVLLQITDGIMPLNPDQIAVIGSCETSDGHKFQTYGYRYVKGMDEPLAGDGKIMMVLPAPRRAKLHSGKVQLETKHVNAGMSGAAVLDAERNLVVGIISSRYVTDDSADPDLAFAVNARVLSLEPLGLPLYSSERYPRKAGQIPKLTDEQFAKLAAAPVPRDYDLSRAPSALPEWVGRADLLKTIHADYLDPNVRVIGLVGYGGEGKSSLIRKALDEILNGETPPQAAFWWSFYEQRSSDEFFEAAVKYLGGDDLSHETINSSMRAGYLASLMRNRRAVFILDGFEVMQHEDGDQYGAIRSEALRGFLNMSATIGAGSLCLVTSRAPLTDLMAHVTYRQHDVARLSAADGRDLLEKVGVRGNPDALDRIVETWDGHALTLSLIGGVLRDLYSGEATRIAAVPAPTADESRYDRVKRVLRRYDEHLNGAERAFLLLFSAFRRPVRAEAAFVKLFCTATEKTMLNAPLVGLDDSAIDKLIEGLIAKRLIRKVTEKDGAHAYTAHPLIRAHYSDLLTNRGDSQAAHNQIADYYKAVAPNNRFDFLTLDELAPYIEVVYHLCAAGAYDEAFEVHREQICRRNEYPSPVLLNAFDAYINYLINFFGGDLDRCPAVVSLTNQRYILDQVGLSLMKLGQHRTAKSFYSRAKAIAIEMDDHYNVSREDISFAEIYNFLGFLDASTVVINRAFDHVWNIMDLHKQQRAEYITYSTLAWTLSLRGNLTGATEAFTRAEALVRTISALNGRKEKYLSTIFGIRHAEHLLRLGDADYAKIVNQENLQLCKDNGWQSEVSQCYRVFGDIKTLTQNHYAASADYYHAVNMARKVDTRYVLIEALIARGCWYAKSMNDARAALNDLNEALEYAVNGEYRIYEADIHVARAWAYLANGDTAQARVEAERAKTDSVHMGYHWGQVDANAVLSVLAGSWSED